MSTANEVHEYEYTTYVPWGHTCDKCDKPINGLERCQRVALERQSGAPAFTYRHVNCTNPQRGC